METLYNFILKKKCKNILIIGDFNFNLAKINTDTSVTKYVQLVKTNNYHFCDLITVTRPSSQSVLDHVITNNLTQKISIHYVDHDISDHSLIFLEIENQRFSQKTNPQKKLPKVTLNIGKLKTSLTTHPITITNDENVNLIYEQYSKSLENHILKSSYSKKLKPKINTQLKSWISNELLCSINAKNYWHKKLNENIRNNRLYETEPLNGHLQEEYIYWKKKVNQSKISTYNSFYKKKN